MRFFVVCSADGGVKALPFRLDLKTGIASEVDARADLAAARARKLVETLGSGDATEAAAVLLWICAGEIHVSKGHVRDARLMWFRKLTNETSIRSLARSVRMALNLVPFPKWTHPKL